MHESLQHKTVYIFVIAVEVFLHVHMTNVGIFLISIIQKVNVVEYKRKE